MATLGIIPGLVSIDGYDVLLKRLTTRFSHDRDAIRVFAYDWRQSNEYTARRLHAYVKHVVGARRKTYPDARLVLIGHSMGGLVARYFAECLDVDRLTRRIITLGTPYLGAVKALGILANGYAQVGPIRFDIATMARSFPSVAELLPVYDWRIPASARSAPVNTLQHVPGLPRAATARCTAFHRTIDHAMQGGIDNRASYHAVLSYRQTTEVWAEVVGDKVVTYPSSQAQDAGDGTVARRSATPPEWADDAHGLFVSGRHSSLHRMKEVFVQLHGVLTARPRHPQATVDEISVDAEPHAVQRIPWRVTVKSSENSDSLVLAMVIDDPANPDRPIMRTPLNPVGDGKYTGTIEFTRPGAFRWTVHPVVGAATPVEPISDVVLCTSTQ